jgi:[ribosomal protein S18]-alanine N-acetyltransferase
VFSSERHLRKHPTQRTQRKAAEKTVIAMSQLVEIRRMRPADIGDVIALEGKCGLNPRSEASFSGELANDTAIWLVAVCRDLAGSQTKMQIGGAFGGRVVLDELQIDNLAVDPALRLQGVGRRLLEAALNSARDTGAIRGVLEVRANNLAAQRLYRKFGFEVVGTRRDYYRQPTEDALVMVCDLSRMATPPAPGSES